MKSLVTTTLILILCATAFAQVQNPQLGIYEVNNRMLPLTRKAQDSLLQAHDIDTVIKITQWYSKKGEANKSHGVGKFALDDQYNVLRYTYSWKGKPYSSAEYTYDSLNHLVMKKKFDKRGDSTRTEIQQFEGNHLAFYQSRNKKGKIQSTMLWGELDANLLTYDFYYKKLKMKYMWKNEFYPDSSKKRVTLTKANGKVKYVWDYQCKEEGQEILKHKDTSTICEVKKNNTDGSVIITTQYVDGKGKVIRKVERRDSLDRMTNTKLFQGKDDELYRETINKYKGDKMAEANYFYYKKGLPKYSSHNIYDDNGHVTSYKRITYKKGVEKWSSSIERSYSSNGLPTGETYISKKSKRITTYQYK